MSETINSQNQEMHLALYAYPVGKVFYIQDEKAVIVLEKQSFRGIWIQSAMSESEKYKITKKGRLHNYTIAQV